MAHRDGRTWRDVTSTDINGYIKAKVGEDVSAKDFRTWHGTVIAAVALAEANQEARTESARKRAVSRAMREVFRVPGQHPGRRPQVLRRPAGDRPVPGRDHHRPDLAAIDDVLGDGTTHGKMERAVLNLLEQ